MAVNHAHFLDMCRGSVGSRWRRIPLVIACSLLGVVASPALSAHAEEVYGRPADGIFRMEGHGWGHGHGLNQWGAQGAALTGVTATKIVETYYPGTAPLVLSDTPIRVLIQEDDGVDLSVTWGEGQFVRDLASTFKKALPQAARWRVWARNGGLQIQHLVGATWHTWQPQTDYTFAGPLSFEGLAWQTVYLPGGVRREYRGAARAVRLDADSIATVNSLTLENYLYGVVPRESPASWHPEALKAQSIAARSYSAYKRDHAPAGAAWDICSTVQCQVYGGRALISAGGTRKELEDARTNAAIQATRGRVRASGGRAIFAEFSSSNGGYSTPGAFPYLTAKPDPWDALKSPHHYWTGQVSAGQIEARYPSVGRLLRMRVTERDGRGEWGGRVKTVILEGQDGQGRATSVQASGGGIMFANQWYGGGNGLRSSWWHIRRALDATIVAQSANPTLVLPPGRVTFETLARIRNTGVSSWSASEVHLALSSPAGGADPLSGGSTKPGYFVQNLTRPGATTVEPGEDAWFKVRFDGTGLAPGAYRGVYRVRLGDGPLFGQPVGWTVRVENARLAAVPVGGPLPATAPPPGGAPPAVSADGIVIVPRGGATGVRLLYRNTGNLDWPVGAKVHLRTSQPRDRTSVSKADDWVTATKPTRVDSVVGREGATTVRPGETGVLVFTLAGNNRPAGTTDEYFELAYDGFAWASGSSVRLRVVRVDSAVSRLAQLVSTSTAPNADTAAYPLGVRTLIVRLRNLGASTWRVGGDDVLGTADPRDRTSRFRDASWLGATRTTRLARNASRPSASAVYPGEVGEWAVRLYPAGVAPGSYTEAFQAAVLGQTWYGPVVRTGLRVRPATFTGSLVRVTPTIVVPRTGTKSVSFVVRNTGDVPWQVGGLVRSVVPTATSPSQHASWVHARRPSTLTTNVTRPGATVVWPGEEARFAFVLAGNGRAAGTYAETFGVVWETWRSLPFSVRLVYTVR